MPVEKETLDALARAYVAPMTSIRGRRVQRLLAREFSRFDHVLWAVAEDGTPAILGLAEDGRVALCRTDGRGASAAVAAWGRLEGATVTTSYDLLKDSLPIVSWAIWHTSFARIAGTLTISAADLSPADQSRVTGTLRKLGA
jgi:hypothetical protein